VGKERRTHNNKTNNNHNTTNFASSLPE